MKNSNKISKNYNNVSEIFQDEEELELEIEEESEGVEIEDTSSDLKMEKPFDPKKIDIKTQQMTIDLLIKRLKAEPIEIDLYPEFQRRDDLWNDKQQSQLIESILISFPLPAFYFDGSDDNKWLVVDGLQRLSALKNFTVKKSLKLTGMEFLTHLDGSSFDDLHRPLQRKIEETQIVAYIINPGTPNAVKFNIYKRVNTGGLLMQGQEIRHAMNPGIPAQFIAELAEHKSFLEATQRKIEKKRMADREFINRFIAFYINPPSEYQPDLDTYMNQAMADLKSKTPSELSQIKLNFIDAIETAHGIFGKWVFRKIDNYPKRKPLSKALFEVWSVALAKLSQNERKLLIEHKDEVFEAFLILNKTNKKFMDALSFGTGDRTRVIYRHNQVENLINKVLNK